MDEVVFFVFFIGDVESVEDCFDFGIGVLDCK